jgi:hypothetical protein
VFGCLGFGCFSFGCWGWGWGFGVLGFSFFLVVGVWVSDFLLFVVPALRLLLCAPRVVLRLGFSFDW